MCPARRQKGGLPSKPVVVPPDVGDRASTIEEIHKECEKIRKENEELQKRIDEYEQNSIKTIEQYRAEIDERTLKTNDTIHQIEGLYQEKAEIIKKLNDDNNRAKQKVFEEDAQVCGEINSFQAQLEIIRKFEEEKDSIAKEIQIKEQSIEEEKRKFEEQIETAKKTTQDLYERNAKQNEESLEKEKEEYYDYLLRSTDQAILLHIQRRNNYENDLLSLRDMSTDYTEKIRSRREANEKLKETIEQLRRDELIDRSADQRKNITSLRKEVASAKAQLKALREKSQKDREQSELERQEESKKVELALKLQQDQLDHKLQQIQALRELTLTVLSYRSQLEAEFITVLGEMIYEVAQRERPGQKVIQSRATRRLSMSSAGSQASRVSTNVGRAKEVSINHILAQFTIEDRYTVLQRFMDRVHGEVEENDRLMSPLLNEDEEGIPKPTSV